MKLSALLEGFQVQVVQGSLELEIESITDDSRAVTHASMFVARQGSTADGLVFVADACSRGALAVLCEQLPPSVPSGVAIIVCSNVVGVSARMAERLAGEPSGRLKLIGITGTNGKTTTAHLIHQMLNASGMTCGLIGTVVVDDGVNRLPSELTTPSAFALSRLLARMWSNGCRACVMEVSSHALAQGRVSGLDFAGAVFTNLTGDHLDFHGTPEAYAEAKSRLFRMLDETGVAVVNVDDPAAVRMVKNCRCNVIRTSLLKQDADALATIQRQNANGIAARVQGAWGHALMQLPLTGRHNVSNALQAMALCHSLGVEVGELLRTLEKCEAPPGRLERVTEVDAPFSVFVDYAHTDDALRNVLSAVKPYVGDGARLHVVFGCGGDRDRTKRARMAAAAWEFADCVVVTSDNPRTEDPLAIIQQILAGVPRTLHERTVVEPDRERAIQHAIDAAREGDIVIIAGKGHEDYQIIGTAKYPFDDRIVSRRVLSSRAELAAL